MVELLLILTLLGIVSSISISSLFGMRENAQVESSAKLLTSMLQEARSKARHSFMLDVGGSSCAIAEYKVVLQTTETPYAVELQGTPYSNCSNPAPQSLRTEELGPGVTMETTPSNLGRIIYEVPSAEVSFISQSNTLLSNNEVQITLSGAKGNAERTVSVDALRGYPETIIP